MEQEPYKVDTFDSEFANLTLEQKAEKALDIALKQINTCYEFKKPRLAKLGKYWALYDGDIPKKLRQLFSVPIPVFPGMIDTLNAQNDTPIRLKYKEGDPSDYFKVKKIQSAWNNDILDSAQNSKWDDKLRTARKHAIMNGIAILEFRPSSDPHYQTNLENVPLKHFNFQPDGGKFIEDHLFAGREDIKRTTADLKKGAKNGIYNKTQVSRLLAYCGNTDQLPADLNNREEIYNRFKPLGLDAGNNAYVGTTVHKLVSHILEIDGERYYIFFDPWTRTWLDFRPWKEIEESNEYPWVTYATHDDDENFLSKAYSDDLYYASDSIVALFNQELTNREKRNFGARAYDKEMFKDVKALDEAMYRPDALVPVDTKGGSRRISEGVYEFKVGELGGTVNLIDWISGTLGQNTGATELSMGSVQDSSKKASVVFAEQKAVSKRLSWSSQPFQSMMADLGRKYIWGLKQHMPAKMAIRMLGEQGLDWDEITRADLKTSKDIDVLIVSTEQEQADNEMKAQKREKALALLAQSPNINSKKRDEEILRFAGYEDAEIAEFLDNVTFADRKSMAMAQQAIQLCLTGKPLTQWYGATVAFMQKILDFTADKRMSITMDQYTKLVQYAMSHREIVQTNIERKVAEQGRIEQANTQQLGGSMMPQQSQASNPGVPGGISKAMNIGNNAI